MVIKQLQVTRNETFNSKSWGTLPWKVQCDTTVVILSKATLTLDTESLRFQDGIYKILVQV